MPARLRLTFGAGLPETWVEVPAGARLATVCVEHPVAVPVWLPLPGHPQFGFHAMPAEAALRFEHAAMTMAARHGC